jgi:uncharacterized protein
MDDMTCPKCQGAMTARTFSGASVSRCERCQGVFLDSTSLGALIEAENDWHAHRSNSTAPIPRITPDMSAPPPSATPARSFLDALFRQ